MNYYNINYFFADSAYSSISNIYNLTQNGFNVIMGRNKQHIQKDTLINHITRDARKKYKSRTVSENFFGNIERYPCIINIYEKYVKSYKGLFTFVLCIGLAKKINKIIRLINDRNAAIYEKQSYEKNKSDAIRRKKERIKETEERKQLNDKVKKEHDRYTQHINDKISAIIEKNTDMKMIKKVYDRYIKVSQRRKPYNIFKKKCTR